MRKGLLSCLSALLLLTGCGAKKEPEPSAVPTGEAVQELSELDLFRNELIKKGSPAGFAWAGEEGLARGELAQAYPFVTEIPDSRIVKGTDEDLFVIVPADPSVSVTVLRDGKKVWSDKKGEPFAVYAVRYDRNTEVRLTSIEGKTVKIIPELVQGRIYDEGSVSVIENFTVSVPEKEPETARWMESLFKVLSEVPMMDHWYSAGKLDTVEKNDDDLEEVVLEEKTCRIISFAPDHESDPVRIFAVADDRNAVWEYHQAKDMWYLRKQKAHTFSLEEIRDDLLNHEQMPAGFAYLGEDGIDGDRADYFGFIDEIDEDHIIGKGPEYYLVVPADENAWVTVKDVSYNPDGDVLYAAENGSPFIIRTDNEKGDPPVVVEVLYDNDVSVVFMPVDVPGNILTVDTEWEVLNLLGLDYLGQDAGEEAVREAVLEVRPDLKELEMAYMFDKYDRIDIDWHPCQIICFGTDHEDSFVRELTFAVSEDAMHVYEYDAVSDAWYEI